MRKIGFVLLWYIYAGYNMGKNVSTKLPSGWQTQNTPLASFFPLVSGPNSYSNETSLPF